MVANRYIRINYQIDQSKVMTRQVELLTASPYIYFNSNPITDPLINNFDLLKEEFFIAAQQRKVASAAGKIINIRSVLKNTNISPKLNNSMYSGNFNSITLYMTSLFLDEPEKKEVSWRDNEEERFAWNLLDLMPFTKSYLLEHKDAIGAFNYNVSYPGSRLEHHLGLNPNYIRLHYCLMASLGCVFDIEGWRHSWQEKELFGFDDGNVFHGTDHKISDYSQPRIILMIDMKKSYIDKYAKNIFYRSFTPTRQELISQIKFNKWDS
jgi:hypothetical protein